MVLLQRHESLESLAARVGVTPFYLRRVFKQEKNASESLTDRLHRELGITAWHFIIGATDTLHAEKCV